MFKMTRLARPVAYICNPRAQKTEAGGSKFTAYLNYIDRPISINKTK
jgi:hypothetical protein